MNAQYIANKNRLKEEKGTYWFRSIHIAQSIYRSIRGRKINWPSEKTDIYDLTLALGIESLPKIDHDGIYTGRKNDFYWHETQIRSMLDSLKKAEPEDE